MYAKHRKKLIGSIVLIEKVTVKEESKSHSTYLSEWLFMLHFICSNILLDAFTIPGQCWVVLYSMSMS